MDLWMQESGSWREGLGQDKISSAFHLEQSFLPSTIHTVLSPELFLSVHTSPPLHAPEGCWEKTVLLGQNLPRVRLCSVFTLDCVSLECTKFLKFGVAPLTVLLLTPVFVCVCSPQPWYEILHSWIMLRKLWDFLAYMKLLLWTDRAMGVQRNGYIRYI